MGLLVYVGLSVGCGILGLWRVWSLPRSSARATCGVTDYLLIAGIGLAIVYLAIAVTGPVTNYDTGLYHLGAVRYQQEFGLVPGLANLYFPLGYGNSVVTLSAFAGSTPWGANGFRLFNGLLLVLMAADLILRIRQGRRGPGYYLLVLSIAFVWIPLVALSDYWVVSPTSDSSVLILTTVSVVYLCDGVSQGVRSLSRVDALSISVILGMVLLTMRPTMAVFTAGVLAVVILVLVRWRRKVGSRTTLHMRLIGAVVIALGVALMTVQGARDRILSGWWEYPLSLLRFEVPWSAPDPVGYRTATLGAARNPDDLWHAAESWDWIPGWLTRMPTQWEFWAALCLAAVSGLSIVVASRTKSPWSPRRLVLTALPSGVATVAWFLASPPYFRFVWGPIFTLLALPAAWAVNGVVLRSTQRSRLAWVRPVLVGGLSIALLGVLAYCAVERSHVGDRNESHVWSIGSVQFHYRVVAVPVVAIAPSTLESGLRIVSPTNSDQCWAVYPLCTPQVEPTVSLAGATLGQGFLP
jgi:hypothetical protein